MKTMPLPEIIDRLTTVGNCSPQQADAFLNEFTSLVVQALTESGDLHVKGLGTFRCIEIGDERTVEFAPDATLAAEVNAPFAMFDPVELDDAVTAEMLATAADAPADGTVVPLQPEPTQKPEQTPQEETPLKETPAATAPHPSTPTPPPAPAPTPPPMPHHTPAPPTPREQVTHEKIIEKERVVEIVGHHHRIIVLALTAIIALIAGVAIGYFVNEKINLTSAKNVNISADNVQVYHQATSPDSISATASTPVPTDLDSDSTGKEDIDAKTKNAEPTAPAVVTDTVRSNRFLTTMAREHYGKKIFWVYIYEENRSKLNHPDRIAANTVVVIPPASKYGIKAGDAQSEADAEKRAAEIMNHYAK